MSDIASEWTPTETETPTTRLVEHAKSYCREEEFRSALDSYIAAYTDWKRSRVETVRWPIGVRFIGSDFAGLAKSLGHQLAVGNELEGRHLRAG